MAPVTDTPGPSFERLVDIMRRLRAPDGCPWDREQTPASLRPFVLEETYEVLEAIEHGTPADLCEELGDFLFEAVFLARIHEEAGHFSIGDVVEGIADKLVRRHPHVFERARRRGRADERPGDRALGVAESARTRAGRQDGRRQPPKQKTTLSGVPKTLPALLRAYELSSRAAAVGFDWAKAGRRARQDRRRGGRAAARGRVGRHRPPVARRGRDGRPAVLDRQPVPQAGHRARGRAAPRQRQVHHAGSRRWRRAFAERGVSLPDATLDEMEAEWQKAKQT